MTATHALTGKLMSSLSADRSEVTLKILLGDDQIGQLNLQVPQIEGLIHQLAFLRSSMAEQVPEDLEPGAKVLAVEDPGWQARIHDGSSGPGVVLALRHPGIGWLVNFLPRATAQALGRSLLDLSRLL